MTRRDLGNILTRALYFMNELMKTWEAEPEGRPKPPFAMPSHYEDPLQQNTNWRSKLFLR